MATQLKPLKKPDSLDVHFRRVEQSGSKVVSFEANDDVHPGLTTQEVWTRLHYNRPYVSRSVIDKAFPDTTYYKHQITAAKMMFTSDSVMIVHDPGTGKTITLLHAMMELFKARAINGFFIINNSNPGNRVALDTLRNIVYKDYEDYLGIPVEKFIKHAIRTTTNQRLLKTPFKSHFGYIFDEAHNLLTDDKRPEVGKLEILETLIPLLGNLDGLKCCFSTATPLFGDADGSSKYTQLLFRSVYAPQKIPTSMSSYTRINYIHLNVEQVLNPKYENFEPPGNGDISFYLINGYFYEFKVYLNKPAPFQIKKFIEMAKNNTINTFQSKGKPMIVASSEKNSRGETIIQSNMLDSILTEIKKTTYGTIIIYSELVDDGSEKVAKFLDQHGFERFNGSSAGSRISTHGSANPFSSKQKSLMISLSRKEEEIFELKRKLNNTDKKYLEALKEQLSVLSKYSAGSAYDSFKMYVNDYEYLYLEDEETFEKIEFLTTELEELRSQYDNIVKQRKIEEKGVNKIKYFVYSSTRTAADEKAFREFNSDANWDGSICKLIIGSKVMRDGVDIKHAVQTHIIIPEWRIPGIVQAQHRGIRSSGHESIVHHLAEKLTKESNLNEDIDKPPITYQEARKIIIEQKITVQIYHHYISVDLLSPQDIQFAIVTYPEVFKDYLDEDPEDLLNLLKKNASKHGAAAIMYQNAIDTHKKVGASMMEIWKGALDYKLNVNIDQRLSLEDPNDEEARMNQVQLYNKETLIGIRDTELFYMEEYTSSIIIKITELLLKKSIINTDLIFKCFLEPDEECETFLNDQGIDRLSIGKDIIVTESMIATAITEMVQYRKYIYNESLGINMLVRLYENEEESILYLSTSGSVYDSGSHLDMEGNRVDTHPYTSYIETIGYTVTGALERKLTRVTLDDLKLPKGHQTFYKLKDLIKRAMDGKEVLSQPDISFLRQMSNYWAFSWKDISRPGVTKSNMSVYVFEGHIRNPSINVLAKDLQVHEYRPTTKTWRVTTTLGLRGVTLVRYATLIYCYRAFKFHEHAEFFSHRRFTENAAVFNDRDQNGIILVKGYYDPDFQKDHLVDILLSKETVLPKPVGTSVLIKKFTSSQSRGSQILNDLPKGINTTHEEAVSYLKGIAERDITIFFFLYDLDQFTRGEAIDILDIKRIEYMEMLSAIEGNPSPRFKICAVEQANITEEKRREIYQAIYKLPEGSF
jgi:hypothetical protein